MSVHHGYVSGSDGLSKCDGWYGKCWLGSPYWSLKVKKGAIFFFRRPFWTLQKRSFISVFPPHNLVHWERARSLYLWSFFCFGGGGVVKTPRNSEILPTGEWTSLWTLSNISVNHLVNQRPLSTYCTINVRETRSELSGNNVNIYPAFDVSSGWSKWWSCHYHSYVFLKWDFSR